MSQSENEKKALVIAQCGSYFVWNVEDVIWLRENCRIVGSFIGSLAGSSLQNEQLGIPLLLLPEEVILLVSKGFAQIYQLPKELDVEFGKAFLAKREENVQKQIQAHEEKVKKSKLAQAETIAKGRKAKQMKLAAANLESSEKKPPAKRLKVTEADLNSISVTQEEISAVIQEIIDTPVPPISEDQIHVELCTGFDLSKCSPYEIVNFPLTDRDRLRTLVYEELWAKGNYLTTGLKFGCDFLVYPGDPLEYHSSYMAICLLPNEKFKETDVYGCVRLGTQVKKTVLLCRWDEKDNKKISYVSLNWQSDRIKY